MTDSTFSGMTGQDSYQEIDPFGLGSSATMSDQEIRARALECAVRHYSADREWCSESDFWKGVLEFEAYIRDGK